MSPGFPNSYPSSLTCVYYVHSVPGSLVSLSFLSFDLEFSTDCAYDYLTVTLLYSLHVMHIMQPVSCMCQFELAFGFRHANKIFHED